MDASCESQIEVFQKSLINMGVYQE